VSIITTPNPFHTAIQIAVSGQRIADSNIEIAVYNTNGKIMKKLSATSYQLSAGIAWTAVGLPSGVYLLKARIGNRVFTKKLLLNK
jgi:hypothetical protein